MASSAVVLASWDMRKPAKPASNRGGRAPNAETRAAMAEAESMIRGRRARRSHSGNSLEPKFTRAEQRRIRAHILARGMTFKAFLPESLANWLRKKIRAGLFHDPAEAAFVAFQDLHELDRHPKVRRELLGAMLQAAIGDRRSAARHPRRESDG